MLTDIYSNVGATICRAQAKKIYNTIRDFVLRSCHVYQKVFRVSFKPGSWAC